MTNTCSVCTQSLSTKSPGLQCSFCSVFFHGKCLSLSKEQVSAFLLITGASYKCSTCVEKNNNGSDDTVTNAISKLENVIKQLQQEVQSLKKKVEVEAVTKDNTELIIGEIADRQSREKNLIVYNVIEPSSANAQAADATVVADIIQSINPDLHLENIKAYRIGKHRNTQPRPLKDVLHSREDVFQVLKHKRKLQQSANEGMRKIQTSTDRTAMQREQFKKVMESLNVRKTNGETDLFIRYVNGNPTVVKSAKPKN